MPERPEGESAYTAGSPMRTPGSPHSAWIYLAITLAAAAAVATVLVMEPGRADWLAAAVLAAAAGVAAVWRVRLPGQDQPASLSLIPILAALKYQPPWIAFVLALGTAVVAGVRTKPRPRPALLVWNLCRNGLALGSAWFVCSLPVFESGAELLALFAASLTYCVVQASIDAVRLKISHSAPVWRVSGDRIFASISVALLAPVCVWALDLWATSPHTGVRLWLVALLLAAAFYLRSYQVRRQSEPDKQDDVAALAQHLTRAQMRGVEPEISPSRRRLLQQVTSSPDQLDAFYNILRVLGADVNFEKSIRQTLSILREAIPCHKAGVFVVEEGRYVLLQGEGFPAHCADRLALPAEAGLLLHMENSRRPEMWNGRIEPAGNPSQQRYFEDVACTLAAPLEIGPETLGAIILCSERPGAFARRQAHLLELIAEKLASTVLASRALQRIYLEAETDEITQLPNARACFRRLDAELARAVREQQSLAVLFLDLDRLKPINDTHGHAAGDRVLQAVGQRLRTSLRPYDFVGRVGGDEFLAVLSGVRSDEVNAKVKYLKSVVANTAVPVPSGKWAGTTVSIGAAVYPDEALEAEDLICLSDQRMYADKQRTRHLAAAG